MFICNNRPVPCCFVPLVTAARHVHCSTGDGGECTGAAILMAAIFRDVGRGCWYHYFSTFLPCGFVLSTSTCLNRPTTRRMLFVPTLPPDRCSSSIAASKVAGKIPLEMVFGVASEGKRLTFAVHALTFRAAPPYLNDSRASALHTQLILWASAHPITNEGLALAGCITGNY